MTQPIVRIQQLHKNFGSLEVLKGVDLEVTKGEVVVILGPSGSGKSTMLRCINKLEQPTGGKIFFEDTEITGAGTDINKIREKIGMVFQQFNLFPHLTAKGNVMLAQQRVLHRSKADADRTAVAFIVGALLQAALGIAQFAVQHDVGLRWLGEPVLRTDMRGVAVFYDIHHAKILRAYGTFPHPNVLAAYLMTALWVTAWMWARHMGTVLRRVWVWPAATALLTVTVTFVSAETVFVLSVPGGVRLATIFTMKWSIWSSPSFFKNVLVTLTTTASMGIKASNEA